MDRPGDGKLQDGFCEDKVGEYRVVDSDNEIWWWNRLCGKETLPLLPGRKDKIGRPRIEQCHCQPVQYGVGWRFRQSGAAASLGAPDVG